MAKWTLLPGEREWLSAVVSNLRDDLPKLAYSDWLEEKGDARGHFLRAFVHAAKTMTPADFPRAQRFSEEWLELVGYRLLERVAASGLRELKPRVLRLARPALRMVQARTPDKKIAIGASKIGGLPDLPADFPWVPGGDCHAIYNDDTGGTDRLAGFLAQVNCAEVAHTQAGKDLPECGVLSFFCFQDIEDDNPDAVGVKAVYFPDSAKLVRTDPPEELTEGNRKMPPHRLTFAETLDLPDDDGPWEADLKPDHEKDYDPVLGLFRVLNFENMLGYGRGTSGGDPTPNKQSRHLILLTNNAGCRLHIQINKKHLAARRFDKITLNWVDFD
jgi:uncharacterized protein (TIGR02996 family)